MKNDIRQLHKEFMAEREFSTGRSSETLRGYQVCFDLLLKRFPDFDLGMISSKIMTEFFRWMRKRERVVGRGRVVSGVKDSTVLTYRSKLNSFFEWLIKEKHIKENPFRGMKRPVVEYTDKKNLEKSEVEKIIAAVVTNMQWKNLLVKKRNIVIINLFLWCGLRRGELLGLKLYDLNLEKRRLKVSAKDSKSKKDRMVYLNHRTRESLNDYLQERRKTGYKTEFLLVSNNRDDRITTHGLKHLINKLVVQSGVKFHVHRFRHTNAMQYYHESNGNNHSLLKHLGNQDPRMIERYLRCMVDKTMQNTLESMDIDNLY